MFDKVTVLRKYQDISRDITETLKKCFTFKDVFRAEFIKHIPDHNRHAVSYPDSRADAPVVHHEGVCSHGNEEGSNVRVSVVGS